MRATLIAKNKMKLNDRVELLGVRRACGCMAALWPASGKDAEGAAEEVADKMRGTVVGIVSREVEKAFAEVSCGCRHATRWDKGCEFARVTAKDCRESMRSYLANCGAGQALIEKLGLGETCKTVPYLYTDELTRAVGKHFEVRVNEEGAPAVLDWTVRGTNSWCEMRFTCGDVAVSRRGRGLSGALESMLTLGFGAITRNTLGSVTAWRDEVWLKPTVRAVGGIAPAGLGASVDATKVIAMVSGLVAMHQLRIDMRFGGAAFTNAEAFLGSRAAGARHWLGDVLAEELSERGKLEDFLGQDLGREAWEECRGSEQKAALIAKGAAKVMGVVFPEVRT